MRWEFGHIMRLLSRFNPRIEQKSGRSGPCLGREEAAASAIQRLLGGGGEVETRGGGGFLGHGCQGGQAAEQLLEGVAPRRAQGPNRIMLTTSCDAIKLKSRGSTM